MYTLFLDTHYKEILIYIYKDNKLLISKHLKDIKNTSIETMPCLIEALKQANITINDINKIAVCIGPGSFTSIRIGVTIAKTLSYSLHIPIVTLTSLDLISLNQTEPTYVATKENNGVFIAFYDAKEVKQIKYLKQAEYNKFMLKNSVKEDNNDDIDANKLINYINSLTPMNPHNVNPLYVKQIEALKW